VIGIIAVIIFLLWVRTMLWYFALFYNEMKKTIEDGRATPTSFWDDYDTGGR